MLTIPLDWLLEIERPHSMTSLKQSRLDEVVKVVAVNKAVTERNELKSNTEKSVKKAPFKFYKKGKVTKKEKVEIKRTSMNIFV